MKRSLAWVSMIATAAALVGCGNEGDSEPVPAGQAVPPPTQTLPEPPVQQQPQGMAHADLQPTQGNNASGHLMVETAENGVRITGEVRGLQPSSTHGFHIHENGDCSAPDASSAGGHFAPLGAPHGAPGPDTHVGDLGNITANEQGVANVDVLAPRATLQDASTGVVGKALIVHAKADDLKTQPSGDAGDRIACGVIQQ